MEIKPKFKKWTKKELEEFCEDNFIEPEQWLWEFIGKAEKVHMEMNIDENKAGDLVVIIRGED